MARHDKIYIIHSYHSGKRFRLIKAITERIPISEKEKQSQKTHVEREIVSSQKYNVAGVRHGNCI